MSFEYVLDKGFESDSPNDSFAPVIYRCIERPFLDDLLHKLHSSLVQKVFQYSIYPPFLPAYIVANPGFDGLVKLAYENQLKPIIRDFEIFTLKLRWAPSVDSYKKILTGDIHFLESYQDSFYGLSLVVYNGFYGTDHIIIFFDFVEHEKAKILRRLE